MAKNDEEYTVELKDCWGFSLKMDDARHLFILIIIVNSISSFKICLLLLYSIVFVSALSNTTFTK